MMDTRKILDLLGAAERMWERAPASVPAQNVVALAGVYAQLAIADEVHQLHQLVDDLTEHLRSIAVSLAALVELSGSTGNMNDDGELPF